MSYASINGLSMYYEVHGAGDPLVLLHGNLSTIDIDFGAMIPALAKSRQVIAVEQQAHGRTTDIDRPLTIKNWAADTTALLAHLGVESADLFGYSSGSAVALQIAVDHPRLVRKLITASAAFNRAGLHPAVVDGVGDLQPEHLTGTPFEAAYAQVAPRPEDWPVLISKISEMNRSISEWPIETIEAIDKPALIIIGDSDITRPEHAVEMFRLFGGGVIGDLMGLPASRLAILPGTTHVTLVHRADWLAAMVEEFLDFSPGA